MSIFDSFMKFMDTPIDNPKPVKNDKLDKKQHIEELTPEMEVNKKRLAHFEESKQFTSTNGIPFRLHIDNKNKMFYIEYIHLPKEPYVFTFDELIGYAISEDGGITETKGGLGAAVAGGVLFGPAGAIVGGTVGKKKSKASINSLIITISMNVLDHESIDLKLLNGKAKVGSYVYSAVKKQEREVCSLFDFIISNQTKEEPIQQINQASQADEILKFKNLADQGIITQEEFEKKKIQLLDL